MTSEPAGRRRQRGTTLVEALVAVLALSFGMLGLARIHAQLRLAADSARHRSEAVRLAQADIERLRGFAVVDGSGVPAAGPASWAGRVVSARTRVDGSATGSPAFTLDRQVDTTAWPAARSVRVEVCWTDRAGTVHRVVLASIVAASDPALGGVSGLIPDGSP